MKKIKELSSTDNVTDSISTNQIARSHADVSPCRFGAGPRAVSQNPGM
jgi:hypothetical protein